MSTGGSFSFGRWFVSQILRLVVGFGYITVIGLITSLWRRRFSWHAWFAGMGFTAAGCIVLEWLCVPYLASDDRPLILFVAGLFIVAGAGAIMGKISQSLAVWESYSLAIFTGISIFIHGAYGLNALFRDESAKTYIDLTWGLQTLGPMWDRLVILWALCAIFAGLIGSSLSYLFAGKNNNDQLEWNMAKRYLIGNDGGLWSVQSVVTVSGIALGVASLIAVTSVMSGYQREVEDKLLGTNAHVVLQKYGVDFVEYPAITGALDQHPEVAATAPFVFSEAMLAGAADGLRVLIKGIVPNASPNVTSVALHMCERMVENTCKHFARPEDGKKAVVAYIADQDGIPSTIVGIELFRKLGKPIGSVFSLITPVGMSGKSNNAPKRMNFRIGGVFASGMYEFDSRLLYMALPAAQQLLGLDGSVTGIEIKLKNPARALVIGESLAQSVGGYPYRALDWRKLNASIFTALKLQKIVMFLVLLCIVIVAAFNIASTLFMNVIDRTQEIGILKAIGADDARVMRIFVYQGWMAGGMGAILGVILGLVTSWVLAQVHIGLAANVYMIDSLRIVINPWEVMATVVATLAISHLATLYPALRAAETLPADAVRA